jgi:hypothetical protein
MPPLYQISYVPVKVRKRHSVSRRLRVPDYGPIAKDAARRDLTFTVGTAGDANSSGPLIGISVT